MDRPPSVRWALRGAAMFGLGVAMFVAAEAASLAHGPRPLTVVFIALTPTFALMAFIFIAIAAAKNTAELRPLLGRQYPRTRAARHKRRNAREVADPHRR